MDHAEYLTQLGLNGWQGWAGAEQQNLLRGVQPLVDALGGAHRFAEIYLGVAFNRADTGSALALAYKHKIELKADAPFSAWSLVHELAHVWDARNDWGLSAAMLRYTGGFVNRRISNLIRHIPFLWDAEKNSATSMPGRYGRKPGCNAAGYFYGDKPSGSNWRFNPREDFAESIVMYCGWNKDNQLTRTAHGRITRYLLKNGDRDPLYGITDQWADYKGYFYPVNGDYTRTKRWRFVDDLIQGRLKEIAK